MANIRALVKRLKAVKNIRKITRTMELIATGRFKRAMDRATEAAAYTKKISEIVSDLANANLKFSHPLLEQRESEANTVVLVVTSNRGLCGGYNAGILRNAVKRLREFTAEERNYSLEVAGKRGIKFLKFSGYEFEHAYEHFEDKPTFDEVDELASRYIADFIAGRIDRLDVAYTEFKSSSKQEAVIQTLLPFGDLGGEKAAEVAEGDAKKQEGSVDYEFLPSAEQILSEIVPAAFRARLFKCFLDAAVSEQIARMVAMKGATENADEMAGDLSQKYNRARQARITSELSEIIGGAAALD